jgi:hypothetical protein
MGKLFINLCAFIVLFLSCTSREESIGPVGGGSATLRGLVLYSSEDTQLPSPVHIYVFDSFKKCVGIQTLVSGEKNFAFTLPADDYVVYTIAGADDAKYSLPDIKTATPDTPIKLKTPGDTHAELAAQSKRITIKNSGTDNLQITVDRIIAQLTATISDVPDDITSVGITLEPLEEEVLLNGSYEGNGNGKISFELTKMGSLWKTTKPLFTLPGADDVSVTITFANAAGSKKYSYNTPLPLEANSKTTINAAYKSDISELRGSIQCSDWDNEHLVEFEFGEGSDMENSYDERLTQGDIYKECYILDVVKETSRKSDFLMMASIGMTNMGVNDISPVIENFKCGDFTTWRLPTFEEAELLYNLCKRGLDDLNKILKDAKISLIVPETNYICMGPDGDFYSYIMNSPTFKATKIGATSKIRYGVRFVTNVTVRWDAD